MMASSNTTPQAEDVLLRLVRVVRRADAFVLGFVKCNSPAQQRQLSISLLERLGNKRSLEITLEEPIISLLEELEAVVDIANFPDVVNIYGLEKSIYAHEDYSPALGRLNNDRDLIRRACPAVLLLWLPDYALDKVSVSSPDFWAWRSGVYEFPTEKKRWHSECALRLNTGWPALLSLSHQEKQQEIERLEELLRTAQNIPHRKREKSIIARLSLQLGILYDALGSWNKAWECIEKSRRLAEDVGDQSLQSSAMHDLAALEDLRGNTDAARHLYEQSLLLSEQIGDGRGVAIGLIDLAYIHADKEELVTAQHLFEQSLQAFDQLTDKKTFNVFTEDVSYRANALLGLAHLYCIKEDWKQARSLYERALSIAKNMGNKSLHGIILHQMGILEQMQGNLVEAEALYKNSIQITLRLGDKNGLAASMMQLGELKAEQGNYKETAAYLDRSISILETLQSFWLEAAKVRFEALKDQFGDEIIQKWLREAADLPMEEDGETLLEATVRG